MTDRSISIIRSAVMITAMTAAVTTVLIIGEFVQQRRTFVLVVVIIAVVPVSHVLSRSVKRVNEAL